LSGNLGAHDNLGAQMGQFRARLEQHPREVQRAMAALVVAALHVGLFFVVLMASGRFDGIHESSTPITRLVLLLTHDATEKKGAELPSLTVPVNDADTQEFFKRLLRTPHVRLAPEEAEPSSTSYLPPQLTQSVAPAEAIQVVRTEDAPSTAQAVIVQLSNAEHASLLKRLTKLASELLKTPEKQVTWHEAGKQYVASLALTPASHGDELDRVIAQVSAQDHGKQLTTLITLKRLAFSNFTQMIDEWDPRVQLHDDEIVGRLHINSEFNLMYDGEATPHFLGKVTTAASSFSSASVGIRREQDIFRDGIETRAGRIAMPKDVQPFAWTPHDEHTRVQRIQDDTHIEFLRDGSYVLSTDADSRHIEQDPAPAVYFIGSRNATLYIKGVVTGKVLVYSPQRVVIEGSIRYAHDAREDSHSSDYLGIVSDRTVEVARTSVTGPGDLDIDGAIYAGRRFLVADLDGALHPATLRIFGSVAAGSVSATEPRYSTKIEYDPRFEQVRPPGFPATNKFAVDTWNGEWSETRR
jgi:hypothetical protein